jgi:hypothetical protein
MAEGGQTDDNRVLPGAGVAPSIDRRPEWKAERVRMINHIVNSAMESMSEDEKHRRARGTVIESHFYEPDHRLISNYEKHGGVWTEVMHEKYRHKEDKPRMSGTMLDEIRVTSKKSNENVKEINIADVGISEEARRKKEEKRKNLYS